jgi:sigma-B regulation protein RsbU (phosphoserine phosphatase)
LYSAFAGELVRSRTFRRRYTTERTSPAGVLASMNTILYERQLEEYYCTLCYALFDLRKRTVTLANSGLPYPIRWARGGEGNGGGQATQIEVAGVPLGSFPGSSYDEVTLSLQEGDLFVFCSDGVSDTRDVIGREFGDARLLRVIDQAADKPARDVVDAVTAAVLEFRGEAAPHDDMTVVAIRILNERHG